MDVYTHRVAHIEKSRRVTNAEQVYAFSFFSFLGLDADFSFLSFFSFLLLDGVEASSEAFLFVPPQACGPSSAMTSCIIAMFFRGAVPLS